MSQEAVPDRVAPEPVRELLPGAVKVVEAATRQFADRGYHGTSVRDIASDAQMTVAGLYHHFPSKQELLRWIMVESLEDVLHRTRAALAAVADDPRARLRALVVAWLRFHTERQDEALIGSAELRSLEPANREAVVALRDEQEALFHGVIEDGRAAGTFTTPHPKEATRAIITMGWAVASWFRRSGPLTPDELGERYALLALQLAGTPAEDLPADGRALPGAAGVG